MLATLLLSQGVPMILSGDEIGKSQFGNNNTYCQDNEISWINWNQVDQSLFDFTKKLIRLRKQHPAFSRKRWFQGQPIRGIGVEDIAWFSPDGTQMDDAKWNDARALSVGVFLNGLGLRCLDDDGEKMTDNNFFLVFNAHEQALDFTLPAAAFGDEWQIVFNSASPFEPGDDYYAPEQKFPVPGRSLVLLQSENKSVDKIPPESLPELANTSQ
jgi:isoamylase